MENLLKDLREKGRVTILTPAGIRVIRSEAEIPPRYRDPKRWEVRPVRFDFSEKERQGR